MSSVWEDFQVDFTHYNELNGVSFVSTIDHFFINDSFSSNIVDSGVLHDPSNLSDHCPIYCKINLDGIRKDVEISQNLPPPKPSWKKSSPTEKRNYKMRLNSLLTCLQQPESLRQCSDLKCTNPDHIVASDNFMISVLDMVEQAAEETLTIPVTKIAKKRVIPGWVDQVQPFKEKAHFWHQVWLSAGRPLNCQLHLVMKHSRNVYHYQIRKCKKAENLIRKTKLLDACLNGNGDIFTEIKKMRKSQPVVASSIDGKADKLYALINYT